MGRTKAEIAGRTAPALRRLWVVAQDPSLRVNRRVLTAQVTVPWEELEPGPLGHRVHVIDYDASTRTFYRPARLPASSDEPPDDDTITDDPWFHAQNVYALVMRTLARFEFALGRRVSWGFRAHQLKVVPHAFEAANAFYAPDSESLSFGYYRRGGGVVYTCLSHDIVVHETSHALLHGLRSRFMAPSSPDQGAFHEGFSDCIALLSVFSIRGLVERLIDSSADADRRRTRRGLIHRDLVREPRLRQSVLFGLADEMDAETAGARVNALRRSVELEPGEVDLTEPDYLEEHRRGEVLVAAVMRTFLDVWTRRLAALGSVDGAYLDRERVAEEGSDVADQLLTMLVRAIDYTPPIHLEFGDFLSAVITADSEVRGEDHRYELRATLLHWFGRFGIRPASGTSDGSWVRADEVRLTRHGVRFGSLQVDPTEMFRLVWANRRSLKLDPSAYTRVSSVRQCVRVGPEDGLPVRETVAECVQYLSLEAADLPRYGLRKPPTVDGATEIVLEGGSTLILDEFGTLKYEVHDKLPLRSEPAALERTQRRLDFLAEQGYFEEGGNLTQRLSELHRRRALGDAGVRSERW